jgi:hypothetical protein
MKKPGVLPTLASRSFRILAAVAVFLVAIPVPVHADGGPMVDPRLFDKLKEGQQTAVVTIRDLTTARVDLFVSILDQTGESHDITYFVPLGVSPSALSVREENSLAFNDALTKDFDRVLFQETRQDQDILLSLYAGTLLTNGVWLMPLWLPLLAGCGGNEAAISVVTTESSTVSVFDINETTDVAALASTAGLDLSVTDTLRRLQGQQIAVINMKTQAATPPGPSNGESVTGEPGLHLSWDTSLQPSGGNMTYAYPLGTGAAWAQPIELTRVYVVAPASLGLSVAFPRLGANRSGYTRLSAGRYEPRVVGDPGEAAYAVEQGRTSLIMPALGWQEVNIWRATYTHSNAAEDIVITVKENAGSDLRERLRQGGILYDFGAGLVAAALFWILSWYLLMPRLLGRKDRKGLWLRPFAYMGINLLLLIIPGVILMILLTFGQKAGPLFITFVVFGAAGAVTFIVKDLNKLGTPGGRAIRSFIIVTLVSNAAYLLFALGYARLAGAI